MYIYIYIYMYIYIYIYIYIYVYIYIYIYVYIYIYIYEVTFIAGLTSLFVTSRVTRRCTGEKVATSRAYDSLLYPVTF